MENETLYNNYKRALEQKYNAVCFDIDGTLTTTNTKKIDKKAIEYLSKLLKKRIPIVFITGRGETGLQDLYEDIIKELKDEYRLNEELYNLYALINDGARLFYTDVDKKKLFGKSEYVSSSQSLEQLRMFNDEVIQKLADSSLSQYCKITYSIASDTKKILNIRIVMNTMNPKIEDLILNNISNILLDPQYSFLNVTVGVHENNKVIQIGTAIKGKAIKRVEQLLGIPENSMLRIGD